VQSEELQRQHYDRIARDYEAHYGDACSQQYREKFIYDPMFDGVELGGRRVLEAMCGSGETTGYLLGRGARVTGLDISEREIESFRRRWPACDALAGSIFASGLETESFDCVVVIGGLHHLHPRVHDALGEIHRVLKPGGHFCFMEPHAGSLPDAVRRFWYARDHLFAANEEALDIPALKRDSARWFEFRREIYSGNVAYMLVLNSMVFRLPLRWKPVYTPVLMPVESVVHRLQGPRTSCFVVAQWQKRQA
jgi:SAM-dependent methyltransferase